MPPKRTRRASRACDHCRARRLRCSDPDENGSCMSCLIYRTQCVFSPRKKYTFARHENSAAPRGRLSAILPREDQRNSISVADAKSNHFQPALISPSVDTASDDEVEVKNGKTQNANLPSPQSVHSPSGFRSRENRVAKMILSAALEQRYAADLNTCPRPSSVSDDDDNASDIEDLVNPLIVESEDDSDDIHDLPEENWDPGFQVIDYLVNAYFQNVHKLYPVLDEAKFRLRIRSHQLQNEADGDIMLALLQVVLVTGSVSVQDTIFQKNDLKYLRESLLRRVLSATPMIYSRSSLLSVQVAFILSLYYAQVHRLGKAWFWCGVATRLFKAFGLHRPKSLQPTNRGLEQRFMGSAFILESHLEFMRYRDGLQLREQEVKPISKEDRAEYPIFAMRLDLARLVHMFCSFYRQGTLVPSELPDKIDRVLCGLEDWRLALQPGQRPGEAICVDESAYQQVLLVHLGYHGLLMIAITAVSAAAEFFPQHINLKSHRSLRLRTHSRQVIDEARRVLQTLNAIADSTHLQPSVLSWLHPIHVVPAFVSVYRQIMKQNLPHSAASDLQLLRSACEHFCTLSMDTSRDRKTHERMVFMTKQAALKISETRIGGYMSSSGDSTSPFDGSASSKMSHSIDGTLAAGSISQQVTFNQQHTQEMTTAEFSAPAVSSSQNTVQPFGFMFPEMDANINELLGHNLAGITDPGNSTFW